MRHTVLHAMLLITSVTTSFLAWNYRQKARDIEQDVAQLHLHSFVTIKALMRIQCSHSNICRTFQPY